MFQQKGCGEKKIAGIRRYGGDRFRLEIYNIDEELPPVLDDSSAYLPAELDADLVLDFLKHPDLGEDLARMCASRSIPVVASGRKTPAEGVLAPPT